MALTRDRLGNYIALVERPNASLQYGLDDVRGVNNLKKMITTKADMAGRKLDKFQIVMPGEFFFNHRTSRNGSKFSVTYNYDDRPHIVTEDYVVFEVADTDALNPLWLYMYLSRAEFDRYVIQNSWGSSTEFYNWEDLCDVELVLPPLDVQERYANLFASMQANQASYDGGLEDLKLTCDAYVEKLIDELEPVCIRPYLQLSDERNDGSLSANDVRGLSTGKQMITTKANLSGVNLRNYKVVKPGMIAYVADTSRRGEKISLAMNETNDTCLVSTISIVFATDEEYLLPEYFMLLLTRSEFDRYARFNSWGSARETFSWEDMCDVKIPVPTLEVQRAIANMYLAYRQRMQINERLKQQLSQLCPILIKGSIEEAERQG